MRDRKLAKSLDGGDGLNKLIGTSTDPRPVPDSRIQREQRPLPKKKGWPIIVWTLPPTYPFDTDEASGEE